MLGVTYFYETLNCLIIVLIKHQANNQFYDFFTKILTVSEICPLFPYKWPVIAVPAILYLQLRDQP